MKTKNTLATWLLPLALSILATIYVAQPPSAVAQGTTFTYQGRLASGTDAANGIYDFTFALWNASSGGSQTGSTLSRSGVGVTNGLFTTLLDFGGVFDGTTYWLEIGVRTNGAASFTTLRPRQQLTPTPYAITAEHLSGTLPSSQLTGTLPAGLLSGTYGGVVNFNNASDSFAGNGSGLVNVNALTLGGLGANAFWKLTGNAGTTAGVNYVGTSDAQPLYLDVNGIPVLKLAANGALSMGSLTGIGSSSVALGNSAAATGMFSTVSGGSLNGAGGDYSTIGGGQMNQILVNLSSFSSGTNAVIGGGYSNKVWCVDSVIAGGSLNHIGSGGGALYQGEGHVIGGGERNGINYENGDSTIGGGYSNFVDSSCSTIAGGARNRINWNGPTYGNTIGGGQVNTITAMGGSTIAGGSLNRILNNSWGCACIGGGYTNTANGNYSTVPGGYGNVANGDYSFAAGRQAKAMHQGAFVWADYTVADFASIKSNEFAVRASGGIRLIGSPTNSSLMVAPSETASEDNSEILLAEDHDGTFGMLLRYDGGDNRLDIIGKSSSTTYTNVSIDRSSARVGINTINPSFNLHVNGSAGKPGGGSWSVASDARLKKNIQPLSGVLDKLLQLHGVSFEYKDPEAIHELPGKRMGLIAQEVEPVFPDWVETGPDGMKRLTVRGFEALTIEALRELRQEKDAHIAALEKDVSELRELVEALTKQQEGGVK